MVLIKIYLYLCSYLKLFLYKIIFNSKLKLGHRVVVRNGFSLIIEKEGKIEIGNNCFFNNYCSIVSMSSITIDEGTIFGENVKIYDHNHRYDDKSMLLKKQGYTSAPIKIGKNCWVGSNVVILKGVNIGDNCVIGAGCVVYKNIEDGTVLINKQDLMRR
ncbi:acyltransferase [Sphingobacterium sp. LRF_L2]|uniref:acyltransferase n=1 Tax=Sphingobacterium sp. LRF_L2 TaxID=3369421 RepID=UPI003F633ADF